MSSPQNLTLIASSDELCASCGGPNCVGASTSSFTCLQNPVKKVETEPKDKPQPTTRVKKYVGDVNPPESEYLDLSSHLVTYHHMYITYLISDGAQIWNPSSKRTSVVSCCSPSSTLT